MWKLKGLTNPDVLYWQIKDKKNYMANNNIIVRSDENNPSKVSNNT